jgi:hypothetical protein
MPRTRSNSNSRDELYLKIVIDPIRVCAHYKPKFGHGAKAGGLTLQQFRSLYQGDPFYNWFGLDNPLMYAAHKAAGGMTSVYRQIGIGCEKLFRTILKDSFNLAATDVVWSYELPLPTGKTRTVHLDGRLPLDKISNTKKRERFHAWMGAYARKIGVASKVFDSLSGTVFEVRQGYKSKDSKRQNADIANAATAYAKGYFPCAVILSAQIDRDILLRYRAEGWSVLTAIIGENDPLVSTYDFMRAVVGYDLAAFFERNSHALRTEIDTVLKGLLAPETT